MQILDSRPRELKAKRQKSFTPASPTWLVREAENHDKWHTRVFGKLINRRDDLGRLAYNAPVPGSGIDLRTCQPRREFVRAFLGVLKLWDVNDGTHRFVHAELFDDEGWLHVQYSDIPELKLNDDNYNPRRMTIKNHD